MIKITYKLSIPKPHTHYFQVKIEVENIKTNMLNFKMATWTPGSYLIREYSKNVQEIRVFDNKSNNISFVKTAKNTWKVKTVNLEKITFSYQVYAFDWTVRTCFVDNNHASIIGAGAFMWIEGFEKSNAILEIDLPKNWQKISTALKNIEGQKHIFHIPDFDTLIDSPIELGNQQIFDFQALNIPHKFATYNIDNFDKEKLQADVINIVENATKFLGENPCKDYLFITHFSEDSRGGLEHLDSTSLIFPKTDFFTKEGYLSYLTLVAHEYFHIWNGKRLAPSELINFDYEKENYTTLLWIVEGFTSYYQYLILHQAGFLSDAELLEKILDYINFIENQAGQKVQSLAESSFDAWIKLYRQNENSQNSMISYYSKGAVIAFMLDLEIIKSTNSTKNLDDFTRLLYQKYYKGNHIGYTEASIKSDLETLTKSDFTDFFQKYIYGISEIDYTYYFDILGFDIKDENLSKANVNTGIKFKQNKIKSIKKDSSAYNSGLNVNDKVIALNHQSIKDIETWISNQKIGDEVIFTVLRKGNLMDIKVILEKDKTKNYQIHVQEEISETQEKFYKKCLSR